MSILPNVSRTFLLINSTCSLLETSHWQIRVVPEKFEIFFSTSRSFSFLRATRTTFACFFANLIAVASPIPLEAPVMTTTLFLKSIRRPTNNENKAVSIGLPW